MLLPIATSRIQIGLKYINKWLQLQLRILVPAGKYVHYNVSRAMKPAIEAVLEDAMVIGGCDKLREAFAFNEVTQG